jgi:A/G-specific adenine glycosylase
LRKTERETRVISTLLRWYRRNGRKLPWRGQRNPYRVLLSEIMLQQTQVSRVLLKYPLFLKRFPTLEKLARARTSTVIRAWQGMGYNNRAVRLQQLASHVVKNLSGKLPVTPAELGKLPGIGRYTAHAVACLAFKQPLPVVDTNIARVLRRLFPEKLKRSNFPRRDANAIWTAAEEILPKSRASDWNQALMDLGSQICTARAPECGACPVSKLCPSAHRPLWTSPAAVKREPHRDGVPNRIYRGRIVEVLRSLKRGQHVRVPDIGRRIKSKFGKRDDAWLHQLLKDLERDGLVRLKGNGSTVSVGLPDR